MFHSLRTFAAKIAANIISHRVRIGTIAVGIATNKTINWTFEFVLYPLVIARLGLIIGGSVMTILSFVLSYLMLLGYTWSKRDWLGIETLKNLREHSGANRWQKYMAQVMRRGNWLAFIFLSVFSEPVVTTLYMRRGAHEYNKLDRSDWQIFVASTLISNFFWTLGVGFLIWLFRMFIGSTGA